MAGISVGAAAFEGFRVIGRHPLAVLAWAVVLFVLTVLPALFSIGMILPMMEEAFQGFPDKELDTAVLLSMQAKLMAINPLLMLASLVARVLILCAICRAVLTPRDRGFAYLRLGSAELWTGLAAVCLLVLFFIILMFGMVGAAIVAIASGAMADTGGGEAAVLFAMLLVLAVMFWLSLRLSMAVPMSFEQRTFRLFESWSLTRGHTLNLLALALLLFVIFLLVMAVIGAATVGLAVAFIPDEGALTTFFSRPFAVWSAELTPWIVGIGAVGSLIGAAMSAILMAPWAAVYRQLAPEAAQA